MGEWEAISRKCGRFYCQHHDKWCFGVSFETGECTRKSCYPPASEVIVQKEISEDEERPTDVIPDSKRISTITLFKIERNQAAKALLLEKLRIELARINSEEKRRII